MSTKLYCGNLSWDCRREDLEELFSKYGAVEDAFIANDRETGRSRGFGFVTLTDGAESAISELNETDFMGRTIRVSEAQAPGTGGGDRGGRGGGFRGGGGGGRGYGDREGGGRGRSSYGDREGGGGYGGRGGGGGGGRGGYRSREEY
eukprot:CAMPEP_0119103618 /NCGR_PEP_ID=MMETSP1180-20130426/2014_1 /TAXON_ID=3052 ORGANISM="Chlamydomonas cf sp, Strain CCMP681" /NCGR_SAMPLE_ID=MMETSP1180 /ASSEMBLY_ACC=CAM_ASM_000741 /LENGTH=146 /DNA_ID=CAMNT_0007088173 /DNA_START=178 /DNA_END=618 /DNA_ORIENTATION=-